MNYSSLKFLTILIGESRQMKRMSSTGSLQMTNGGSWKDDRILVPLQNRPADPFLSNTFEIDENFAVINERVCLQRQEEVALEEWNRRVDQLTDEECCTLCSHLPSDQQSMLSRSEYDYKHCEVRMTICGSEVTRPVTATFLTLFLAMDIKVSPSPSPLAADRSKCFGESVSEVEMVDTIVNFSLVNNFFRVTHAF